MSWDFFEGLGALIAFLVVGGLWIEMAERRDNRRSSLTTQRHSSVGGSSPSSEALEAFLASMEPVRRALSRMTVHERERWHRKAHEVMREVQTIDQWLHAVSTWAPHQRESVVESAQDKVLLRQRLIMDFAREVLQAQAPSNPATEKPAGEI